MNPTEVAHSTSTLGEPRRPNISDKRDDRMRSINTQGKERGRNNGNETNDVKTNHEEEWSSVGLLKPTQEKNKSYVYSAKSLGSRRALNENRESSLC